MQITQTLSVLHNGSRGVLAPDARQFPDGCDGESGRVAVKLERSAAVVDEQMVRSIREPLLEPLLDPPAGTCRAIESASFQRPIYYYSEV